MTRIYLCSFNSPTKEEVYRGLKRKFQMTELITGRELCDLFRIDYNSIVEHRQKDQWGNLEYIAHELLAIDGVREVVLGCARTLRSTRMLRSIDLRRQSGSSHQSLGSAVSIGTTFGWDNR
jgi:hypothetical protein